MISVCLVKPPIVLGFISLIYLQTILISTVSSHGRLMEPPNRSSLWRFPEFSKYNPLVNYDDNELFCGGYHIQHEINEGKCGLCGDEYNMTRPRTNEHLGEYGKGVISRRYKQGQELPVAIELTFGHLGYFQFRLCQILDDTHTETDDCFDQYLLSLADGSGTEFPVSELGAQWYKFNISLPKNVTCEHCVLQWHYVAGNNHGDCKNGTSAIGCGPQETFRGCADIAVLKE